MGARMGDTEKIMKSVDEHMFQSNDADDDSDLARTKQFENGHWIWDEGNECLAYVSDIPPEVVEAIGTKYTLKQNIEFSDDVDLIEQIRYRRRYQRKLLPGEPDIITLQDVKDIALFTAPFNILSPTLINMLHTITVERFLRALILYCQYYLQVKNEMAKRMSENLVRTQNSYDIEAELQDNLADLRVLVSKEYSMLVIGGSDMIKFHHMGPLKKRQSLSNRDARQLQTFLRMCVQIVWLALGRRNFTELEVEINRLVKGNTFNDVEHAGKEDSYSQMNATEKSVLYGGCINKDRMLNLRSPLNYELSCVRHVDYRMLCFGVIQHNKMSSRLKYMQLAVTGPEEDYEKYGVSVGILGKARSGFDTMLNYIIRPKETSSNASVKSPQSIPQNREKEVSIQAKIGKLSVPDTKSSHRSSNAVSIGVKKLYSDIVLPPKYAEDMVMQVPDVFPEENPAVLRCNEIQWRRWQVRLHRLLHPRGVVLPRRQDAGASQQKFAQHSGAGNVVQKIAKDASNLYVRGRR